MASTKPPRRREPAVTKHETHAWFEAWDRIMPGYRHGIVLGLLLVIAIWFMSPVLFSDGVLIGGDIFQWKAMAQSIVGEGAETGSKPLWATNPFGGMPGYMISYDMVVPQIDLIGKWLRLLIWPLSHLLLLFAGAYGFVFHLTRERLAAAISAVGFGLSTYLPILLVAGHNSKYVTLAYLPWLLWAFVYALRTPGLLGSLLFAAALAVNLRAGHVQITYYGVFVMAAFWITDGVAALRTGGVRPFAITTAKLAAGGILAVLMVAQPYMAQAGYKAFTIRGATAGSTEGGMGWEYAMAWSQGIGELLTLFIADAFGGTGATYWGPKTFTGGPHYVGSIVLLLAAIAIWVSRSRTVVALGAVALLMTLFSLGENAAWLNRLMYDHFPLFDAFRVPETWLSVVALVLAALAGLGAVEAVRDEAPVRAGRDRAVTTISIAAVAIALVFVFMGDSLLDFSKPGEADTLASQVAQQRPDLDVRDPQVQQFITQEISRRQAERVDVYARDARRTLLFTVAAALLLLLVRRRKVPGWVAQAGLVVLVAADLGGVSHRYLSADRLVPASVADRPIERHAFDDWILERRAEAGGVGSFRVLSLEGDPTVTARPAFWYETVSGYHGAKLRVFQDYLDALLFDRNQGYLSANALRMANVRYVVAGFPMPGMEPVFQDETREMTVYEVPDALPRAWFVDAVEVVETPAEQWARLSDAGFDPSRVAVVSTGAASLTPAPRDSTSTLSVRSTSYASDRFAFDVETDRERLLVVSEVYYPAGWKARLDGADIAIERVNYLFRGVVVPAGSHRVEFTFEPDSHRIGVAVAGVSTGIVYGLIAWLLVAAWLKRRRAQAS